MTFTSFAFLGGAVSAQIRVSDKEIEKMMKNLNEDVKKFTSSFDSGVGKTSIRKTTREKDSKALVKTFEQQTAGMLRNFSKHKQAEAEVKLVLGSADRINLLLEEVNFDGRTASSWKRIQEELDMLSKALGV